MLYLVTALVVLTAGLVSLLTGWYPFAIETGPLGFLGYTMHIDNNTNYDVLIRAQPVRVSSFSSLWQVFSSGSDRPSEPCKAP